MTNKEEKKQDVKDEKDEAKLSEEDEALRSQLLDSLDIAMDTKTKNDIRQKAVDRLCDEVQKSTGSMTGVPKPLKFLKPRYSDVIDLAEGKTKLKSLYDLSSALSMTMGQPGDVVKYKLMGDGNVVDWGHEYVRCLSGEVGAEWIKRVEGNEETTDLRPLVDEMVTYYLAHNSESAAIDLLVEVSLISNLSSTTVEDVDRVTRYLIKTSDYLDGEESLECLTVAKGMFEKADRHCDAVRVAIKIGGPGLNEACKKALEASKDVKDRLQIAAVLGRSKIPFDVEEEGVEGVDDDEIEKLNDLVSNASLSDFFLNLGRDLDVVDPKKPEDIYKSHLSETGGFSRRQQSNAKVDSARANLASTFVNGFVNAGFNTDKLLTVENSDWLYKNKEHGMLSATASLGLLMLWNVEEGLTVIDKYLYSNEEMVKAGACLGVGVLCAGVRSEADPAFALLSEHVEGADGEMKRASVQGLGIAYAGSGREEVGEVLVKVVEECEDWVAVGLAGLSLGMIYVKGMEGADDIAMAIVTRLMEASEDNLKHSHTKFLCLGLGLLWMGKMEECDATVEALKTLSDSSVSKFAINTVVGCAYAGSGNVLKVQQMLHECAEHLEKDADHQAVAALSIAMITMGEEVGAEMTLRTCDHLLQYCELPIKRAVPLMLATLHVSDADYTIVDTLSRLTHHEDEQISQNAIMGLGVISAGTNNSRVAGLLRQLSEFYSKEAGHMFTVRIAQGLLHMGKGLMGISPITSDKLLMNGPAFGGLMAVIFSCLDMKATLLDKSHQILFYLSAAMNPRMLVTVDESLEWKPTTVRVGQAVEIVGAPGKPKSITGFQTHQTPVLLSSRERAELGTEEFLACTGVLEGIVVIKENPDYKPPEDEEKK
ncbi:hypothetical protein TrRE_jg8589 [Triparma retinervis]|uniref:26S proteasome non-ATPase regulatory subunit 2 homolog n=1 Tax=Triparma retinervis TaxID=2557542 RepID=A0A9W7DMV3_9STRA|nr:hypothetical protein TrRE_jg8589 [Triparma retinervis]